ncbi:MAG: hypothetical protein H6Q04_1504, partial [Acidobacteria bacterium]|nr:hypothetical protein [Acidobacteriota bacterium]
MFFNQRFSHNDWSIKLVQVNRAVADQADDFQWSRTAGADQGICLVRFLDQPRPRTPRLARQLRTAVGSVLRHALIKKDGAGILTGAAMAVINFVIIIVGIISVFAGGLGL